ncbi:MAG TPA: T9SS type A sorting domain-containing protein, partial [Niastella sp.]
DLINAGVTSSGITYNGSAPDLGAIESGNTSTTYSLTTNVSPSGGGSVSRSPNATTYASGTVVTLTATPASGYTFTGWSGGASGTNTSTTVTMNANTSVTANFTNSTGTSYTLTTTVSPTAGGTITRSPNATTYTAGTVVTLTATPASGYSFSSWSGGASGTSTTTTVTMNANTSVTANFTTSSGGTTLRIDDKSGTGIGYCSANGSRQNTYTGADGGYYINLSNSSGQGITWATSAGSAGTYNIRWRYSNAGTQSATTARVLVNGVQAVASVAFPLTATWSTWTTTAWIPVTLVAGANKIRLETTVSSEFAMIDWIEISGNNPTEVSCSAATGARMVTQNEGAETNVIVEGSPIVVPNPTQGLSTVRFTISGQQKVIVNLYGSDGRLVSTLANRLFAAGTHALPVDYKGLQKGVYFISVSYGGKQRILQNILTR